MAGGQLVERHFGCADAVTDWSDHYSICITNNTNNIIKSVTAAVIITTTAAAVLNCWIAVTAVRAMTVIKGASVEETPRATLIAITGTVVTIVTAAAYNSCL